MVTSTARALDALREAVGDAWVIEEQAQLLPYAVSTDPQGDTFPACVVKPANTTEVQALVEIANRHRLPLQPISRGLQHGLGMATAVDAGTVTVDLSRMDRILGYDADLGYVVVEPGVTFAQLYGFLREHDAPYWMSPISGPIDASVIGNALDKGAGYTPLGNHFGNLIGLEVVIGDGRVLVTGDGALGSAKTRYTHKGGCGPMLDALFAQSNLGIVTRAGVWLMPAPPGARAFVFSFPDYAAVERAAEVAGRLKLSGAIPSTVSIANDLFCIAVASDTPIAPGQPGVPPIADDDLDGWRERFGVGAWNVVGCLYGPPAELPARVERLRDAFAATGEVRYIDEEEARANKAFRYRCDIAQGIPNEDELDVYGLHERGSSLYFLPSVPFRGAAAREAMELSKRICAVHGFAYTSQFLGSPRSMRNTQPVIFDSGDPGARARVQTCFGDLIDAFEQAGYLVSRPPTQYQETVAAKLGLASELANGIKQVFDPNGIIAPGRYGMRVQEPAGAGASMEVSEWD